MRRSDEREETLHSRQLASKRAYRLDSEAGQNLENTVTIASEGTFMQAREIVMFGKLASAQGYCDAIIKTSSESGAVKCAEMALADITEVLQHFRSQSAKDCGNG